VKTQRDCRSLSPFNASAGASQDPLNVQPLDVYETRRLMAVHGVDL
jgi:flavoprotein